MFDESTGDDAGIISTLASKRNMPNIALTLLAGALILHGLPTLPEWQVFVAPICLSLVCAARRPFRGIAAFIAGFSLTGVFAALQLEDWLDPALESKILEVNVVVETFPREQAGMVSMVVRPAADGALPARLRLTWFEPRLVPRLGETWRLTLRLRRPGGLVNPGGYDTEGWLFLSKIGATGYVVEDGRNYRVVGTAENAVDRLRRHVVERIERLLPQDDAAAVLMAIAVGARHRISNDQWDAYAATGTSHLMAISGLHIGLAAASVYLFSWGILALLPGPRNCRDPAMIVSLAAASAYAVMSGFAVPARRALVMLSTAVFLRWHRREGTPSGLLAATLIVVLLTDPLSVLLPGFQLSFAAVAILFATSRQLVCVTPIAAGSRPATSMLRLWLVQLALLAGLLPMTVSLFDRFSAIAPAVNLLVLPIFNIATVPLVILGMLLDGALAPLGDALLGFACMSVKAVLVLIRYAQTADWLTYRVSVPVPAALVLLPLLFVLLPQGWPGRRLAGLAVFCIVLAEPDRVPRACFEYHVLDVGQGLAVVVRTADRALLFDTGPAFRSGADTAERVVLPFLEYRGIDRLDVVVVSHADLDHAGGIGSLLSGTVVGRVISGEPLAGMAYAREPCVDGDAWRWNEVDFRFLHPRPNTPWRGNNASCVLEISAGDRRMLLTGDIESPVEILLEYRDKLRSAYVLTVPHHGSRTSSAEVLVRATRPALAIVSASRSNRWGFPKENIVERWRRSGAAVYGTATSGAISQRICPAGEPGPVAEARQDRSRYWHER